MKPTCTIFVDASHDQTTGAAGWAVWIKADDRPAIFRSGAFKEAISSNLLAEALGVANALYIAEQAGVLVRGERAMVQCDCIDALRVLMLLPTTVDSPAPNGRPVLPINPMAKGKAKNIVRAMRKNFAQATAVIFPIATRTGAIFVTRHVKSHQPAGTPGRGFVNRSVDIAARKEMRALRKERIALMVRKTGSLAVVQQEENNAG